VPAHELLERIRAVFPLQAAAPNYPGEVAQRYRFVDGGGELGIIASVTQPFCGDCSRGSSVGAGQLLHLSVCQRRP
jgi:cyclic pyranopterin phosphate synthase